MKRVKTIYIFFYIILILTVLQSCLGIKPGAMRSGKKLFTTFFVGEDGTQYFIKPILLSNNDRSELLIDVTFRYKNQIKDSAIFTFSLNDNIMYKMLDKITINSKNDKIIIENFDFLFVEKYRKEYKSRYTFKISLSDLVKIFKYEELKLEIENEGIKKEFISNSKTKKKIKKINDDIFSLF